MRTGLRRFDYRLALRSRIRRRCDDAARAGLQACVEKFRGTDESQLVVRCRFEHAGGGEASGGIPAKRQSQLRREAARREFTHPLPKLAHPGQWELRHTSSSIVVRAAAEPDYAAIARIQQLCAEAAQWPVGDYAGFQMLIALNDGKAAGFCAWRQTAPDEAELLNLATDPAQRRKGVGSALLEQLCARARGDIFLEVAEGNSPAMALYEAQGWSAVAVRNGYYQNGKVNAIVMKKRSW
jgi:ribosomal-protein-alanine N-acetyltransferase